MQTSMTPIEKHKSQIERRINQLEEKFREKEVPKNHAKKLREYAQDENKAYPHQGHAISKTVDVRGKIRAQVQPKVTIDTAYFPPYAKEPLSQTGVIKNLRQARQIGKDVKQQKIKELYDMMKQILEGQKNIEKEITDLKKDNTIRNSAIKNNQASFIQDPTPVEASLERVYESKEKQKQKRNRMAEKSVNQSLIIKDRAQSKNQRQNRQKKIKSKKDNEFEAYLEEMRSQSRDGQRLCVGEEWKTRVWAEVEGRVKESERQYKDTIHRNNKHEFDHLTNTFQLQRKLKDDLLQKIYQQCNSQIYK